MFYFLFAFRIAVLIPILLFAGCATILHGTRQRVAVTSDPPGAVVSNGEVSVETPAVLDLPRNRDYIITITKPGFEAEGVKIVHVVSGIVAAELIAPGGIIGVGIDASNGALYQLEPDTLKVTLRPLEEHEKVDGGTRPSIATLAGKLEELNGLKEKELLTQEEYQSMREVAVRSVAS
ncbi:MAG: hypothetical protein M1305_05210 [Candidatus Marsarchaeota archaeon]|nr:hypothetical protein [Candidatus Marsarchaeota archaeon]